MTEQQKAARREELDEQLRYYTEQAQSLDLAYAESSIARRIGERLAAIRHELEGLQDDQP